MKPRKTKIGILDAVVALFLIGTAAYIIHRLSMGLQYRWNWGAIPQYLFRYDAGDGGWVPNMLMEGLFNTIRLSVWGIVLATVIGTAMGLCRVSRSLSNRLFGHIYVELIRNLPPLVLIFIFYFFLSDQILPVLGLDKLAYSGSEGLQRLLTFFFAPPPCLCRFSPA